MSHNSSKFKDDLAVKYRQRSSLKKAFSSWHNTAKDPERVAPKNGVYVYAGFKWINKSLANYNSDNLFPFHAAIGSTGTENSALLKRIRNYMIDKLDLPASSLPLFEHALAMLDVFQLTRMFKAWKTYYKRIKTINQHASKSTRKRIFYWWQQIVRNKRLLAENQEIILNRQGKYILKRTFKVWKSALKSNLFRKKTGPKSRKHHAFRRFRGMLRENQLQRLSIRNGYNLFLHKLLINCYRVWISKLSKIASMQSLSQALLLKQWILVFVRTSWRKSEATHFLFTITVAGRSRFFSTHPFVAYLRREFEQEDGTASDQQSEDIDFEELENSFFSQVPTPSRHVGTYGADSPTHASFLGNSTFDRSFQLEDLTSTVLPTSSDERRPEREDTMNDSLTGWLRRRTTGRSYPTQRKAHTHFQLPLPSAPLRNPPIVPPKPPGVDGKSTMLQCNLRSRQSQQWLGRCGAELRLRRAQFYTFRRWILRIPQIRQDKPSYLGFTDAMMRFQHFRANSRFLSLETRLFSTDLEDAFRMYRRLRHGLLRWVVQTRRKMFLRVRWRFLRNRTKQLYQTKVFGGWLITAARNQQLKRAANRVVCNQFQKTLWRAWFAWSHHYERSVLIRANKRELLALKSRELNEFIQKRSSRQDHKSQFTVLKDWAFVVRDRKLGRKLIDLWNRTAGRRFLFLGFARWKFLMDLDTIVTCVKRLFRGYYTRKYLIPGERDYMIWVSGQLPKVTAFRRRKRHQLVMKVFRLYRVKLSEMWVINGADLSCRRAWGRLRQFSFKHYRVCQERVRCVAFWKKNQKKDVLKCLFRHRNRLRWIKKLKINTNYGFFLRFWGSLIQRMTLTRTYHVARKNYMQRLVREGFKYFLTWTLTHHHLYKQQKRSRRLFTLKVFRKWRVENCRLKRIRRFKVVALARRWRRFFLNWVNFMQLKSWRRNCSKFHYFERKLFHGWQTWRRSFLRRSSRLGSNRFSYLLSDPAQRTHRGVRVDAAAAWNTFLKKRKSGAVFGIIRGVVSVRIRSHVELWKHFTGLRVYRNTKLRRFLDRKAKIRLILSLRLWFSQCYRGKVKGKKKGGSKMGKPNRGKKIGFYHLIDHRVKRIQENLSRTETESAECRGFDRWLKHYHHVHRSRLIHQSMVRDYWKRKLGHYLQKLHRKAWKRRKYRKSLKHLVSELEWKAVSSVFEKLVKFTKKRKTRFLALQKFRRDFYKTAVRRFYLELQRRQEAKQYKFKLVCVVRLKKLVQFACLRLRKNAWWCRHSPAARVMLLMNRKMKFLRFRKFSQLLLLNRYRHAILKTSFNHHQTFQCRRCLRYWRRFLGLKSELAGIVRRIALFPFMRHWLQQSVFAAQERLVVRRVSARISRRVKRDVLLAWSTFVKREVSLRTRADMVGVRHYLATLARGLLGWIRAIDDKVNHHKFHQVREMHLLYVKRRCLVCWHKHALLSELCTWKSSRTALHHWFRLTFWAQRQRLGRERAVLFSAAYAAQWGLYRWCMLGRGRRAVRRKKWKALNYVRLRELALAMKKWHRRCLGPRQTVRVAPNSDSDDYDYDPSDKHTHHSRSRRDRSMQLAHIATTTNRNRSHSHGRRAHRNNFGASQSRQLRTTKRSAAYLDPRSSMFRAMQFQIQRCFEKWMSRTQETRGGQRRRLLKRNFGAWWNRTFLLRFVREAFRNRLTLLRKRDLLRHCWDKMVWNCEKTRLQKILMGYSELVLKSRVLAAWNTVWRNRQQEKRAMAVIITSVFQRSLFWYFRKWRVRAGPGYRLGATILQRHALHCWRNCWRSGLHYRMFKLSTVFTAWKLYIQSIDWQIRRQMRVRRAMFNVVSRRMRDDLAKVHMAFRIWRGQDDEAALRLQYFYLQASHLPKRDPLAGMTNTLRESRWRGLDTQTGVTPGGAEPPKRLLELQAHAGQQETSLAPAEGLNRDKGFRITPKGFDRGKDQNALINRRLSLLDATDSPMRGAPLGSAFPSLTRARNLRSGFSASWTEGNSQAAGSRGFLSRLGAVDSIQSGNRSVPASPVPSALSTPNVSLLQMSRGRDMNVRELMS